MQIKQTDKLGDAERVTVGWRWWTFQWERSTTTGGGLLAPAHDWCLSAWIRGWRAYIGLTHHLPPRN